MGIPITDLFYVDKCTRTKCLAGEYLCYRENYCISIEQICDGVNQCKHADDEFYCGKV